MKSVTELRAENSELVQELRGKIVTLQDTVQSYRKEHGVLEDFFDELRTAIPPIVPLAQEYKPPKSATVESPCSAVMCNNDGHLGMMQESSEIGGSAGLIQKYVKHVRCITVKVYLIGLPCIGKVINLMSW